MVYWSAAILLVTSITTTASDELIQKSDEPCRAAIEKFANSHGIKVNVITPPCYIAPYSYEGISIKVNQRNLRKLRTYLAASSYTRTCPRIFDVVEAGPGSDRRIR